jgi:hypothetical protein
MPGVIYPYGAQDELGNIDAEQADLNRVYLITTYPFTHLQKAYPKSVRPDCGFYSE